MENKEKQFMTNLKLEVLDKVREKGSYTDEERAYIVSEITTFCLNNDIDYMSPEFGLQTKLNEITNFINEAGYIYVSKNSIGINNNISAEEVEEEIEEEIKEEKEDAKSKDKYRNLKVYALAGLLIVSSVAITKCAMDQQKEIVIEQPVEDEIEFDINSVEELKEGIKFVVEDAATKGIELTAEEALDLMLVANTNSINPELTAYLFTPTKVASDLFKSFNNTTFKYAYDTMMVQDEQDFAKVYRIFNNEKDSDVVLELQTKLAKINATIVKGDKEARVLAVKDAEEFIYNLYRTAEYQKFSPAANTTMIKMLHTSFRLDNGIMDKETRIAIYGSENCEVQNGSIFHTAFTDLEKTFAEKYNSMQIYAINTELEMTREEFLASIELNPILTKRTVTAEEMQLLATTGSKEVKLPSSKTVTVAPVKANDKPVNVTPKDETKTEEAQFVYKPTEIMTVNEAEEAKKAIEDANVASERDRLRDSMYRDYDSKYYANMAFNYWKNYYLSKDVSAAYKEHFNKVYDLNYGLIKDDAAVAGKIDGRAYAIVDEKSTTAPSVSAAIANALVKRPQILDHKIFIDSYTAAFTQAFKVELAEVTKRADAAQVTTETVGNVTTELTVTAPIDITVKESEGEKKVYVDADGDSVVEKPIHDIYYYGEPTHVFEKADLNSVITVAKAQEKGLTFGYILEDDEFVKVSIPEKAKTK